MKPLGLLVLLGVVGCSSTNHTLKVRTLTCLGVCVSAETEHSSTRTKEPKDDNPGQPQRPTHHPTAPE